MLSAESENCNSGRGALVSIAPALTSDAWMNWGDEERSWKWVWMNVSIEGGDDGGSHSDLAPTLKRVNLERVLDFWT